MKIILTVDNFLPIIVLLLISLTSQCCDYKKLGVWRLDTQILLSAIFIVLVIMFLENSYKFKKKINISLIWHIYNYVNQ